MDLITTTSELAAACERLARHSVITVDTEFLPRTQRSAPPLRGVVRCRAGAVTDACVWYGPGSAKQR